MRTAETFTAAEVGAVTGVPVRAVYKAMSERLPRGLAVRRGRERLLTRWGVVCFAIDRDLPKNVPLSVRRQLYAGLAAHRSAPAMRCERGILAYEVDVKAVARKVDAALAGYRRAMRLIVEDDAVQAGAATFRGTRILVHQIALLLAQGAGATELREDYPRLTPEMIAAAPIYARAHPRRGRPRKPAWRRNRSLPDEGGGAVHDGDALPH